MDDQWHEKLNEVRMMRSKILVTALIITFGLALNCYGQKSVQTVQKENDFLGEGLGWMNIPDAEHTSEYLAKVVGIGGNPSAYANENVKGNWTLELRDSRDRPVGKIKLELFQTGTLVYGSGSTADGLIATANGAIADNAMNLNVVTVPKPALYRLRMNLGEVSAGGSFDTFSSAGSIYGNVNAHKDVPRKLS
jgi:hypothetical protein